MTCADSQQQRGTRRIEVTAREIREVDRIAVRAPNPRKALASRAFGRRVGARVGAVVAATAVFAGTLALSWGLTAMLRKIPLVARMI